MQKTELCLWGKSKVFMRAMLCVTLLASILFSGTPGLGLEQAYAQNELSLYTPFTGIVVSPGESIDYQVDVMNDSSSIQHVSFELQGLKEGWDYTLTSSGRDVKQLSVLSGESKTISLQVDVPLQIEKGSYTLELVAKGNQGTVTKLPLTIEIREAGTFSTEFTTEQPNRQGHADASFEFLTKLRNRTAEEQLYSLTAEAPRGWQVRFTANSQNVTSVQVEPNATVDVKVHIQPLTEVEAGSYTIPVRAAANATSAELELEVVVTGSYNLSLSTPSGRLSTEATAGKGKSIELQISNTGSSPLEDISLSSTNPTNWEVEFEPKDIQTLAPGESASVKAIITPDKNAIAGDYVVDIRTRAPEASSSAQFRIAVKTPILWGWIGILIIVAVGAGIFYLFRLYGRR